MIAKEWQMANGQYSKKTMHRSDSAEHCSFAIVHWSFLLYNVLMIQKLTLTTFLCVLMLPQTGLAYLNPEDVLLNRELFLPPEAREAQERTRLQATESAARREREQERAFALQHPVVEEVIEEPETLHAAAPEFPAGGYVVYPTTPAGMVPFGAPGFGAAPSAGLTESANLELLRTMRLLSRVNQNQAASELSQVLHSGAPDLSPTGAPSVIAASIMMGSVLWTMRRAGKKTAVTRGGSVEV